MKVGSGIHGEKVAEWEGMDGRDRPLLDRHERGAFPQMIARSWIANYHRLKIFSTDNKGVYSLLPLVLATCRGRKSDSTHLDLDPDPKIRSIATINNINVEEMSWKIPLEDLGED